MTEELHPHKIICVARVQGKEVGRIPATAPNASEYLEQLASHYGELQVAYEPDPTEGLLAALHSKH